MFDCYVVTWSVCVSELSRTITLSYVINFIYAIYV